jgi:hypothetical protein
VLAAAAGLWQVRDYRRDFLPIQQLTEAGGEHTRLLRTLTDPDDVIVIVGDDWSSIVPYYSQRRALMITNPHEGNEAYLAAAFADLKGSRVGALIISRNSLAHQAILARAQNALGILPGVAVTYNQDFAYYFHEDHAERVEKYLRDNAKGTFNQLRLADPDAYAAPARPQLKEVAVASLSDQSPFAAMTPTPVLNRNPWGATFSTMVEGVRRFNAHAPSELVFRPRPGVHRLSAQYGMMEGAYLRKGPPNTDGVTFAVLIRRARRPDRRLWEMFLDPQNNAADRGLHAIRLNFTLPEGAELILQVGTGRQDNNAFDWAYWGGIEIK